MRTSHKSVLRETELLELIHSDICEFISVIPRNGKQYFITFIDDCSNYCFVYLMKNKSKALNMFKLYITKVENQFNRKIKRFEVIGD